MKVGAGLKRQNTWHRLLSPQDSFDLKKEGERFEEANQLGTIDHNKNKDVIDQITSTV